MAKALDIGEISDSFTKQVKKLLLVAGTVIKGDAQKQALLETVKRKIQIVSREDPLYLLENVGKYLYAYREVIHGDVDDFIACPGKYIREEEASDIQALQTKTDADGSWGAFISCIEMFKTKWETYSADEKKVVTKAVQRMLSSYCKYIIYQTQ